MKVFCKKCNVELTNELVELSDRELLTEDDGKDFLPKGYYFVSDGGYFTASEGKIIINLKDLINTQNHNDFKRLNGCCDLDGMDGINKVCKNGHEIGTVKKDCWMPHCIIFESKLVDPK
ncbi:hypothetical protein [Marinifilum flexuosum]|uniref:Uncharacterized protein n=1 Tax=Marinifilum flexuosum TaxID=1117708 RepID=A0A419WF11_9BACT|nr:hypothetical protein [Marinifilum flexuosum]RKD94078.1 hypothetical protein BXY64_4241 [Marinifilum flexuosum]